MCKLFPTYALRVQASQNIKRLELLSLIIIARGPHAELLGIFSEKWIKENIIKIVENRKSG